MTYPTPEPTRSIWQDTRTSVSTANARATRPAQAEQTRPAAKSQAEKEAERWLAEMMFDHYNG